MRVRLAAMAMSLMVAVAAVGCQPDPGPTPSASSVPTSPAASSASASPSPTDQPTPASSEEALFKEAERVFLKYQEAELAVYAAGGAETMPPSVAPYVMGDYAAAQEQQFRKAKSDGVELRDTDTVQFKWVKQVANQSGSLVAVGACVDKSRMSGRTATTDWQKGQVYVGTWLMKRDADGLLKIFKFTQPDGGCS